MGTALGSLYPRQLYRLSFQCTWFATPTPLQCLTTCGADCTALYHGSGTPSTLPTPPGLRQTFGLTPGASASTLARRPAGAVNYGDLDRPPVPCTLVGGSWDGPHTSGMCCRLFRGCFAGGDVCCKWLFSPLGCTLHRVSLSFCPSCTHTTRTLLRPPNLRPVFLLAACPGEEAYADAVLATSPDTSPLSFEDTVGLTPGRPGRPPGAITYGDAPELKAEKVFGE